MWEGYAIEDVATPRAWKRDPELVLAFYNFRRKAVLDAKPNAAHFGLVDLEQWFNVQIITQNVDDLHERAGSTNVLHLHGEILKMRSTGNASLIYPIVEDIRLGDVAEDGAQLRPHIVWFEEPVPLIETAALLVQEADLFVVIGTSLVVYPAAGLMNETKPSIPKFILDRRIPSVNTLYDVTPIELPATEGMDVLKAQLEAYR